jgi:hypothetical protein
LVLPPVCCPPAELGKSIRLSQYVTNNASNCGWFRTLNQTSTIRICLASRHFF